MVSISNLTFGYNNRNLIDSLDLNVGQNETVAIVGPSGCGKTTLFKLISGVLDSGDKSIRICGESSLKKRMLYISYMMQEDLLLPWRTVLGNLMIVFDLETRGFLSKLRSRCRKKQFKARALKILGDVGLEGFENYYPDQLSGGMRQRVSLARSMLFNRPILLLDEPFRAVDQAKRLELYMLIKALRKKYGLTILLISHDENDAKQLADRTLFFSAGRLLGSASGSSFMEKYFLKSRSTEPIKAKTAL